MAVIFYLFFSAGLISAIRRRILMKFGTLTRSWYKLSTPVANGGYRPPPKKKMGC